MKFFARAAARAFVALALAAAFVSPALALGGKSSASENAILKLIFQGTTFTGVADNTATTPATVLCVALHTADPGVGGSQTTSEAAYTSYARLSVNRNSGGWTVSGNSVAPASTLSFPAATGGTETETYFSVAVPSSGSTCTGALVILYRGPITPNIAVSAGVTPQLTTSTAVTEN